MSSSDFRGYAKLFLNGLPAPSQEAAITLLAGVLKAVAFRAFTEGQKNYLQRDNPYAADPRAMNHEGGSRPMSEQTKPIDLGATPAVEDVPALERTCSACGGNGRYLGGIGLSAGYGTERCEHCGGTGKGPDLERKLCQWCNGRGVVASRVAGQFQTVDCKRCSGSGKEPT